MKKLKSLHPQQWMALSALSTCFLIGSTASAYPLPAQDNRALHDNDDGFDRQEFSNFDRFLDDHRDIGERLRQDPSLANKPDYLQDHPALRDYLRDHPRVREQIQANPNGFMHREERFDRREDRDRGRNGDRRTELISFDNWLDSYPAVDKELRQNPSLVDNQDYLQNHPALRDYLRDHPAVRQQLRENPNGFMRAEERLDRQQDRDRNRDADNRSDADRSRDADNRSDADRNRDADNRSDADRSRDADNRSDANRDRDADRRSDADRTRDADNRSDADRNRDNDRVATNGDRRSDLRDRDDRDDRGGDRREVAQFDQFLDSHREIAEQVRKNPSLLQNAQFVKTHPALQTYLQQHPAVTAEIKENPDTFMHQEASYDRQTGKSGVGGDHDAHYRQFGEFLGGHSDISKQLSKDPSLAKNQEYLANHPELRDYLTQHPDVSKDLAENPQAFITSSQHVGTPATSTTTTSKSTVKTPTTPNQ